MTALAVISGTTLLVLLFLVGLLLRRRGGWSRRARRPESYDLTLIRAIGARLEEGVCVIDRDGLVIYANSAAEKMLDGTSSALLGKPGPQIVPRPVGNSSPRPGGAASSHDLIQPGESVEGAMVTLARNDGSTFLGSYAAAPVSLEGGTSGTLLVIRRKRGDEDVPDVDDLYPSLARSSPDGILFTDLYWFVLMANQRAAAMYGYAAPQEMVGLNVSELIAPDDRVRATQDKRRVAQEDTVTSVEYRSQRKDGTVFPAEMSISVVKNEQGEVQGLAGFVRDISERKQAEEALRASEARLTMQYAVTQALAQSATVDEALWRILQVICTDARWDAGAYWIVDPHQNVLRCHDVWHPPWVSIPEFIDMTWQLVVTSGTGPLGRAWASGDSSWVQDVLTDATFARGITASKEGIHGAFYLPIRVENSVYGVLEFYSHAIRPENEELAEAMAAIGTQVGQFIERKMAENALEHQALHDALTDLPNRSLLFDRLTQALLAARRSKRPLALLVMDLDKFKAVNDTFGHHYGDLLLQEAAERLRATLRGSDTVARLGGDEFAMLLPGTDEKGAILAAEKVVAALEQPFELEGQALDAGISIGVALYPAHGEELSALLRRADAAMYRAKRSHRSYAVYDSGGEEPSGSQPTPAG